MNYIIWLLFLVGGFVLFLFSFKYKFEFPIETHFLMIVGAFFVLISGIIVLTIGVDFPVGEHVRNYPACSLCGGNWTAVYENVTDPVTNRSTLQFKGYEPSLGIINGTNGTYYTQTYIASYDKTPIYSTLKGGLRSFGVSYALIFLSFGLFLVLFLSFGEYQEKKRNRTYSEEDEG